MSREIALNMLRAHAKCRRREPTEAEAALWRILRNRRLSALKFRRQAPIPPYISVLISSRKMSSPTAP
ncbi:MAG TPA: DUF559 domain-containing protein [Methylocystis sp.]|nr:DUF559 domain-containing protein [Methylocystis sp.]